MKNKTLIKAARKILKKLLSKCTEEQQMIFKRMYSHKDLSVSIEEAVDRMDTEKIDLAINQVETTVNNNKKKSRS